ncbi:hypothetical protein BXY82_0669 [Gelidibacter sediminis]|uniref:Uncharacterized protein n=1 Tax=Gelidibacter sediminis TaxID=1608710 RepID=A0A4R7Q8L9_9FLAO|nr:hypothetical protein BXY82_0669 [Gelidibacter sediminis]
MYREPSVFHATKRYLNMYREPSIFSLYPTKMGEEKCTNNRIHFFRMLKLIFEPRSRYVFCNTVKLCSKNTRIDKKSENN